jgi:predicted nuclease of restriction endonuclease-like (RecB) superfamily
MNGRVNANTITKKITNLVNDARQQIVKSINQTIAHSYFEIGRLIVEEEQNGFEKADYGKFLLIELSRNLIKEFGKGFSVTNLKQMRQFYLTYSESVRCEIGQTVSDQFKLSWSHYLVLMRIDDKLERMFYENEAVKNNWSIRELVRQYDSALFTRLILSKDKNGILKLAQKGQIFENPTDAVKDPYILEFIGLQEHNSYSESDLEQRIIDKLESFLLELGAGYTFVARQDRISFDEKHFRIDLVFYNRILKCFVLVDLKVGELKHQDIGQMQMYVNYYDRKVKLKEENKTIGIILCQNKSESIVEYTLPENNKQIFASKYLTILPSKESLQKIIELK